MLDKGKELDWFASNQIVVLAVVTALGLALFLAWELTEEHPVVDLRFFARRNYWTGTLSLSLAYAAFMGALVLLPLWLQQYMGYTATWAGLALAPVGALAILLTPVVGANTHRVDPRIFATISFLIFAVVLWIRGHATTQADFSFIVIPTIVQGVAVAFFFVPLIGLTLSGLKPNEIAAASGLNNFVRITAGSFGTSIATTLWSNRASFHHAQLAEHVSAYDPAAVQTLSALQAMGIGADQARGILNQMVDQQAFTLAANDIFNGAAVLFLCLIAVVWLARPAKGGDSSGAAAAAH
jgi:DHA2 family multidrug resistance protein